MFLHFISGDPKTPLVTAAAYRYLKAAC